MDSLYPARKLRHKFAKTVRDADDNILHFSLTPFLVASGATLATLGGSWMLEDVPQGEVYPDTQIVAQSSEVEAFFSNEITGLAEQREAFLELQDNSAILNNEALQEMRNTGNALNTEADNMVARIVMSDVLSESQAADLLEQFSEDVSSIETLGYAESDFGHLRESRDAVTQSASADWSRIAKDITHAAAAQDADDQTYPFRVFDAEDPAGEKIGIMMLSAMFAGMFSTLGGMILLLISMPLGDSQRIREWAREEPKTKPRRPKYTRH